jgi:hypothetical protein
MEKIATYRIAIESIFTYLEKGSYAIPGIKRIVLKDKDHYLIIRTGWSNDQNLYSMLVHMAIVDEKICIYINNTEHNFEEELIEQGISKEDIIFTDISPTQRQALDYPVA